MSSDLDRIEEFAVIGWLGDFYRVRTNDRTVELPREGITVRSIEDLLEFQNLRALDVELTELEDMARDLFGTRARIDGDKNRGKLVISYYSADDLQRIWEALEAARR